MGVAAVGVVGIGVGGYFALHAKSASDASGCTDGRSCPDQASADRLRSAKSDADLATVLFIAGGALAVTGGVIFLVAPSKSGAAVSLSGAASRELTGVRVIGRW